MKKAQLSLLVLFAFISCTNKKPESSTIITNPKSKDTSTIVKSERTFNPYAIVDVSPMDMTYYPVEYPKLKMSKATTDSPKARVIYSRPHLEGRTLFKNLLKYYDPWRLGANEAT